jgi:hypothetical protein
MTQEPYRPQMHNYDSSVQIYMEWNYEIICCSLSVRNISFFTIDISC